MPNFALLTALLPLFLLWLSSPTSHAGLGRGTPLANKLPSSGRVRSSALDALGMGFAQSGPKQQLPGKPGTASATPPPPPSHAGYQLADELHQPISRPANVVPCNVTILTQQPFYTYEGIVNVTYSPSPACGTTWQLVVVSVGLQVSGRQFDRRFSFSLESLPMVVATTAQPRRPGVVFYVEHDVTDYSTFLKTAHSGQVILGNPTDATYTGIYYVNVTLQFYPGTPPANLPNAVYPVPSAALTVPQNTYKAVAELYVSHYHDDEFYYSFLPTNFYNSLPPALQQYFYNGTAFREVVALLDSSVVGIVFPKPIFYSGAIEPLFWSPFMGPGSLYMPLYTLDLTPFLALLLDGKQHSLQFQVSYASAGSLWITPGALKVWTDPGLSKTTGGVISTQMRYSGVRETVSAFGTLNSNIWTSVFRQYTFSGFVASSLGNITTTVTSILSFSNKIQLFNDGNNEIITHRTYSNSKAVAQSSVVQLSSEGSKSTYPFTLTLLATVHPDGSYNVSNTVEVHLSEDERSTGPARRQKVVLKHDVLAQEQYSVNSDGYITSLAAETDQGYRRKTYAWKDACYGRDGHSKWDYNGTALILTDLEDYKAPKC